MTEQVDVEGLIHELTRHGLRILVEIGVFTTLYPWLPLDHPKQQFTANTSLSQEEITDRLKSYFYTHKSEIGEMCAAVTVLEGLGWNSQ